MGTVGEEITDIRGLGYEIVGTERTNAANTIIIYTEHGDHTLHTARTC